MSKNLICRRLIAVIFSRLPARGAPCAAGAGASPRSPAPGADRRETAVAAARPNPTFLAVRTAGSICRPPADPPFHPDNLAPSPVLTTYIFGFRNVTGLRCRPRSTNQKMKAQHSAPAVLGQPVRRRTGLHAPADQPGPAVRPDLIDAHTLHFHGFRNAIPIFDGEPTARSRVPIGRDLTYFYRPARPGHLHVPLPLRGRRARAHGHGGQVFVRPNGCGPEVRLQRCDVSPSSTASSSMFADRGVGRGALG